MKLLHTSDWHIGRSLFEFSLLDDQREIFEQICSIVRSCLLYTSDAADEL